MMKWFSNLFSKTANTEATDPNKNDELEIEMEVQKEVENFKQSESYKELDTAINRLSCMAMAYRAFYYLTPEETKKEVYSKLPQEAVDFIKEDMNGRDMTSWNR